MPSSTKSDILKIVNRYIGVQGGYLGNFSYNTHAEFYSEYCGLDNINPYELAGTTRERFITILGQAKPYEQAKIIRGVLEKFPVSSDGPQTRTQALHDELLKLACELEDETSVTSPELQITSAVVERAIVDAETLIRANGATTRVV